MDTSMRGSRKCFGGGAQRLFEFAREGGGCPKHISGNFKV